jgi:hypothetical protein
LAFLFWEPDGDNWEDEIKVNEGYPSHVMIYNNIFIVSDSVPDEVSFNNWGVMLGISDSTFTQTSDVYIMNNYFLGNLDVLTIAFGNSLLNKENVFNYKVFNNVFWNVGRDKDGCDTSLTFTVPGTNGGSPVNYGSYGSGASIEVDYNIYSGPGTKIGGTDSSGINWDTYANFKSLTGAQEHDFGSPDIASINFDSNFRPLEGSPVIDAGIDLSSYFTTDKDGVSRPQGLAWDLGAYEYH